MPVQWGKALSHMDKSSRVSFASSHWIQDNSQGFSLYWSTEYTPAVCTEIWKSVPACFHGSVRHVATSIAVTPSSATTPSETDVLEAVELPRLLMGSVTWVNHSGGYQHHAELGLPSLIQKPLKSPKYFCSWQWSRLLLDWNLPLM